MKKRWLLWSAIAGALILLGFLIFPFFLHGTIGFYRVNGVTRLGYIILFSFSLLLILLALLENKLLSRKANISTTISSVSVRLMTVLALLFSLGALYYVGDFFDPFQSTTPQLLLAEGTQSSGVPNMAVTLYSSTATRKSIHWGQGSSVIGTITESAPIKNHVFNLVGLQPATSYWYSIDSGPEYSFTTPSLDQKLKFAVFGDSHFGKASSAVNEMALMTGIMADRSNNYNMLFSLGDLVDFGFRNRQWNEAFSKISPAVSTVPTAFLAGNHDALFTGVGKYKTLAYPTGLPLTSGTQLWHHIDNGKIHFLILDVEWSAESITPAQKIWLERELQSIPREDWTIVMSHGFYYSSGYVTEGWKWYDNPETIAALTPLFEKYGVDIVFSAHNHQMEVLDKNGVTYVICGAFGGDIDPERTYTSPASIWYSVAQHDFVEADINGNTADLIFRGSDGAVIHSYRVENR